VALLVHGLDFSVDFKGGAVFQFPAPSASVTQVQASAARSCRNSAARSASPGRCRPRR
jgi:preprotein translocase subunit SecF